MSIKGEAKMETPTDAGQTDRADEKEPGAKGGVAGTDSKDFDSSGPFSGEPKQDKDPATSSS